MRSWRSTRMPWRRIARATAFKARAEAKGLPFGIDDLCGRSLRPVEALRDQRHRQLLQRLDTRVGVGISAGIDADDTHALPLQAVVEFADLGGDGIFG